MAKNKREELLKAKSPTSLRQAIAPVDILAAAAAPEVERGTVQEKANAQENKEERTEGASEEAFFSKDEEIRSPKALGNLNENTDREIRTLTSPSNSNDLLPIEERTNLPNGNRDAKKRTVISSRERSGKQNDENARKKRTQKSRIFSDKDITQLLAVDKRATERYSFEIYSDQKEDLQVLCDLYEKKTGKKLSASRVLRELLDSFLPGALKTFNEGE